MIIVELIFWGIRFIFGSIIQLIQTPFLLLSSQTSPQEKEQTIKQTLWAAPVSLATYLMFTDRFGVGVFILLITTLLGAMTVKDDGTF